jgi:hypothetical protein
LDNAAQAILGIKNNRSHDAREGGETKRTIEGMATKLNRHSQQQRNIQPRIHMHNTIDHSITGWLGFYNESRLNKLMIHNIAFRPMQTG